MWDVGWGMGDVKGVREAGKGKTGRGCVGLEEHGRGRR